MNVAAERTRVLIVDDEEAQMRALCRTLDMEGYATSGCTSAERALDTLREQRFELLLTDLIMPGMDGVALLAAARERDPHLAGVVMTGHGTIDTAVRAMQTGALDYIQKPFSLNVVLPVLARALAIRRLRLENEGLTRRLQQRTLELEAANKELEAFSHSVSHDLRAPLRAVKGYCEMIAEDHAASLSPAASELLDKVLAAAQRMDRLIEDLLTLSRSARQPLVRRAVDMEALVRRIAGELLAHEKERQLELAIERLPPCSGDASLLEQVLVNLLANAVKFTRGRKDARIEAGARSGSAPDGAAETVYFVRDNGAGFDMQYAYRLFNAFQRLHSAEDFEGTGIGLSIAHRIVRRHGGRIWAESAPGEGATFSFSMPVAAEEA